MTSGAEGIINMSNRWKGLIVVLLVVAVFAIVNSKRHAALTPTPTSPAASAPEPKTRAGRAPAEKGARPAPPGGAAATSATSTARPKALPQMIELGSKTCTPCRMMQPILGELRKEYKGQLAVPFWDIYDHPEKAKAYRIRVIPTQVFVGADGKELFRHEGFFPKADILAKFKELGIVLRGAK